MDKIPVLFIQGGINSTALSKVDEVLLNRSGQSIYVVIQTDGGDPNVGYRIIKLIQAKFKKVYVVVPSECMSTGTLMALGADKIYMRKSACLGPLDTRIRHPNDGSVISSIDERDSASTIAGLVDSAAETFHSTALGKFNLSKQYASKLALDAATRLFQPIADKIDPYHLQASVRSATLGQKYAEELLKSKMMKSNQALAVLVSKYLANYYSSHSYAITKEEAENLLSLNVDDVSSLDLWEDIKQSYNANVKKNYSLIEINNVKIKKGNTKSSKKGGKK